jgi:prevent-host-death family protein
MRLAMRVSVRELKNNLSKYLHRVQQGESIVVTSHNKPMACLHPIPSAPAHLPEISGVRWAREKPDFSTPLESLPKIAGKTLAEIVLEERR